MEFMILFIKTAKPRHEDRDIDGTNRVVYPVFSKNPVIICASKQQIARAEGGEMTTDDHNLLTRA